MVEPRWQRDGLGRFTVERFGCETCQWIAEDNVYDMDKSTVIGLFPYITGSHRSRWRNEESLKLT